MTSTTRRIATAAIATFAAVGSFAFTAQANTALGEGETGTAGPFSITVRTITQPYDGQHSFSVMACNTQKSAATLKSADFSVVGTNGTTVKAVADSDVTDMPLASSTSIEPGECVEGDLSGIVGSDLRSITYQNGALSWTPSAAQGSDRVDFGQTASTKEGLKVTVDDLKALGKDVREFSVEVCSSRQTTIGWNDIKVVGNDGQLRPVGRSEDSMGSDAFPSSATVKAGGCVSGMVRIYAPSGIEYVSVRGLTFVAPQNAPEPTATPSTPQNGQPTLPKTGN